MKLIPVTQAKVGDVVHFYGARFVIEEISNTAIGCSSDLQGPHPAAMNIAKWLDGNVIANYFGPDKKWNFQGNESYKISIE